MVYSGSLDNSFHYDDAHSIVENAHLRSLANIPAFFHDSGMFSVWEDRAMYRPLLLTGCALNLAVSGYQVRGCHLFNLGIRLVVLVFAIGRTAGGTVGGTLGAAPCLPFTRSMPR